MKLSVPSVPLSSVLAVLAVAACASKPDWNTGTGGGGSSAAGKAGNSGSGGIASASGSGVHGTQPPPSANCTDVGVTSTTINTNYGGSSIAVDGNPNKTYYMQANWWHQFDNEVETVDGLGFSISNPNNAVSPDNSPLGYPSIFMGSYSGHTTKGSNLPKQVSALTGVPTVFITNIDSMGTSNYNASYDVWFTASSSPLPSNQYNPGSGGMFLMVWLFKPSDRQPRGSIVASGQTIAGVPGSWDVWWDPGLNPEPCVSYVSTNKLSQLDYDLNAFIQDAVTNRHGVTSSMYLSVVFAGFEVWGGGSGLQAKAFCANVK
jgi:hypothetical protein